jgi:autotransporter-associated beta strand protein
LSALAIAVMALLVAGTAQAATTYTYTNTVAGAKPWNVAANWDANGVPVGASDATVVFFSDTTTALGQPTFTINADPATLTLNTLTLNGLGASATANTAVNIGTAVNTWTFDGTTPTVNLSGMNGTKTLAFTNAPNLTLNQDITFTGNGTAGFIFSGAIGGAGKALTKSGSSTLTLSGANTYSGNTTINGGTLTVANGGAINTPGATINVLTGALTMNSGSAITVQQLLSTNGVLGGATVASAFTMSGGTLITSNAAAIAASILIPSNTAYNMSGNWTMNGGSNLISFVQTNGTWIAPKILGNSFSVNSNAVFQIGNASYPISGSFDVSLGENGNSTLTINNGTMAIVNGMGFGAGWNVGIGNTMNIINGGQFLRTNATSRNFTMGGLNATNNYLYVGGTNSAGARATLRDANAFIIGQNLNGFNNRAIVDQGGTLVGNVLNIQGTANYLIVTNGGQASFVGGNSFIGRNGSFSNCYIIVGGAGTDGSNAAVNFLTLAIGDAYNSSTANTVSNGCLVGQGGRLTAGAVNIGGNSTYTETNTLGNYLIVTNGGRVVSTSSQIGASLGVANNGNWAYVGGAGALWDLSTGAITLGGAGANTNNTLTAGVGGVLTNVSTITLGGVNSSFNLSGDAYVSSVNLSSNTAAMNFSNVGVLHARASSNLLYGIGTNYFLAGGGKIDTVNFSVTNSVSGAGVGGMTKLGSGTLTLSGANSYSGMTTVSNGVLKLTAAGVLDQSSINVVSGATFNVSAWTSGYTLTNNQYLAGNGLVTGSVIVASGAGVSGGTTNNDVGTLTFANNLTLGEGSVVYWNYNATTGDVVNVTGTLTLPTNMVINASGTGTFPNKRVLFTSVNPITYAASTVPTITGTGIRPGSHLVSSPDNLQLMLLTPSGLILSIH